MPRKVNNPIKLWEELKRRRVIRVTTVYAATAFVIIEVTNNITEPLNLPDWLSRWVIIILGVGLLVAIIVSWIFDITPEGIEKTKPAGEVQIADKPVSSNSWKIATFVSIVIIISLLVFNILSGKKQAEDIAILEKSIAVLPFENLSNDVNQAWFSDGITDVVINQLSKIADLRVLSRTSTLKYKVDKKLIPEIGEELGVNYILEGTVQREGNQVRISIQLLRAVNEDHLWSELYDREYKDLFAIQSEIAEVVASELEAIITPNEKQLLEKIPTTDMTAFDLHLQAKDHYFKFLITRNISFLDTVVQFAKKALILDPEFALGYYWLGNSTLGDTWLSTYYKPFYLDSALVYFNKALELDSSLVEAYSGRGTFYFEKAQSQKALSDLKTALRFDPNYAIAYIRLGMIYYDSRDYLNAMLNYKKAETLEKSDGILESIYINKWWIYISVGDLQKAEFYLQDKMNADQAYSLNWWILAIQGKWEELLALAEAGIDALPEEWGAYYLKATALLELGRIAEAEEYIRIALEYSTIEFMDISHRIGIILWANGKKEEAMEFFNNQISFCKKSIDQKNQYGVTSAAYDLAGVYAFLGNREEAMNWLKEYEKLGFTIGNHEYIKVDPLFDNLRNDREFIELVERVNAEKAEIRARINQMEEQGIL